MKAAGGDFIFVCKPSSHPLIQEYVAGAELSACEKTVKKGRKRSVHRYRWICGVPCARNSQFGIGWVSGGPAQPNESAAAPLAGIMAGRAGL